MPSMPSGLPRSLTTWVSQVSMSVGATLVATMIYGALPKITVPQLEPAPALTSGGKFAARALPSDAPEVLAALDAAPALRVAAAVQPVALFAGSVAALQSPGWQAPSTVAVSPAGAPSIPDPLRRTVVGVAPTRNASFEGLSRPVKAVHPSLRADAKHGARVVVAEAATPELTASVSSGTLDGAAEEGLLPKMMSSARSAWSVTASAGDALLARVVPQIP